MRGSLHHLLTGLPNFHLDKGLTNELGQLPIAHVLVELVVGLLLAKDLCTLFASLLLCLPGPMPGLIGWELRSKNCF